jgi:hypothetical protein
VCSLGSKLTLGLLLLVNVLSFASFDEAFADTPANRRMLTPPSAPPPPVGR